MKTSVRVIAAAAICLAAQSSFSQTAIGQPDCGRWLNDGLSEKAQYKAWLMGYLTGVNMSHFAIRKADLLSALSSAEQVFAWMDNYCKANPLNKIGHGGFDLMMELIERSEKPKARK